jgi:hypothetical protein
LLTKIQRAQPLQSRTRVPAKPDLYFRSHVAYEFILPLDRAGHARTPAPSPDDTGKVIGLGLQPGDVKVRWDDTDETTHINAAQLEIMSQLRLVD